MSNPRQDRNRWLAFAVAPSLALVGVVIGLRQVPPHPAVPITQGILTCVILLGGVIGIGGALHSQGKAWGSDRLRAGKDVLARWTVPAEVCRQFRASQGSPLEQPYAVPEGPVEVIIGKRGFLVGELYHSVRRVDACQSFGLVEGATPFLSAQYYSDSESGRTEWSVQVPVPPGAEADARRVWEHFRRRLP